MPGANTRRGRRRRLAEGRWLPAPGKALFAAIARELGPLPIVAEDLGLITPDVIELREGCGFPVM